MAKDDYYVIVYQILSYLYQCLKNGEEPEEKMLGPDSALFKVNRKYWEYIMRHLLRDGYIEGLYVHDYIGGLVISDYENCAITPEGIGFLLDNRFIEKARKFLKDAKEIVPFI